MMKEHLNGCVFQQLLVQENAAYRGHLLQAPQVDVPRKVCGKMKDLDRRRRCQLDQLSQQPHHHQILLQIPVVTDPWQGYTRDYETRPNCSNFT